MNIEEILNQPNGSIQDITINLDSLPYADKYKILEQLLGKIARNGSVTVIGQDIFSVAKSIIDSKQSVEEINNLLTHTRSMDTLDNIKRFLLDRGFKTRNCKRENTIYVCTARYELQ